MKFDFAVPNPKPVVVAKSANDARFFDSERSTPAVEDFFSGSTFLTSSVLSPKLNAANGEGLAGSAGFSIGVAATGKTGLEKLNPDVAGFSAAPPADGVGSTFLPKLNPVVRGAVDVASCLPKLKPVVGATEVGPAPNLKSDAAEEAGDAVAVLTPNLNPD